VPPPDATAVRGATPADWGPDESGGTGGRWWLPIVWGIVALLLLGLLSVGIWLIARAEDSEPATPSASPTPAATSAQPTSAAPSTTGPPPTSQAAPVPVPPLVGLTTVQARAELDALGLTYRLRFSTSDQPAGTVIQTDPAAGTEVPAGTQITLVIATPPRTTAAPPPTTAAPTPTPSGP
jgi:hypothetical protein